MMTRILDISHPLRERFPDAGLRIRQDSGEDPEKHEEQHPRIFHTDKIRTIHEEESEEKTLPPLQFIHQRMQARLCL